MLRSINYFGFKKHPYILGFIFLFSCSLFGQEHLKIKFSKNPGLIYFFQAGNNDTIVKNKSDLFYLFVPDSMKSQVVFQVENGRLQTTANDSLVKVLFMPGFKYESLFFSPPASDKPGKISYKLKTQVNGTSAYQTPNILIQVVDKKKNAVLMENVFIYRE